MPRARKRGLILKKDDVGGGEDGMVSDFKGLGREMKRIDG